MRILHVIGGLNRGGAETMMMNISRNINRNQFKFDFLVYGDEIGDYEHEILAGGGKVIHINKINSNIMNFIYKLFRTLKENGVYDAIHIHTLLNSGIVLLIAKLAKIPIRIVHAHSSQKFSQGAIYLIYEKSMKFFIKNFATSYLACSHEAGQYLFGKNNQYSILKNAIELSRFTFQADVREKYRNELNLEHSFVIGHVGSLTQVKNHDFLLDIFNELIKQEKNAVLLLIGQGILEAKIKEKIAKHNLTDKVIFLGNCSNVDQLLNVMDFFVFPSLFEGLPVSLVEAQASGLKCLVSANVSREIVMSDHIMFLPIEQSAKQWAEMIIRHKTYQRKDMALTISAAGYDIKQSVEYLEKIYLDNSEK